MIKYNQSINKHPFCFMFIFLLLGILSCGINKNENVKSNSNDGLGSYTAKLIFPPDIPRFDSTTQSSAKVIKEGIDCNKAGITVIE